MSAIWSRGSRFGGYQTAFSRGGKLERSNEKRPLPRWQKIEKENLERGIARRLADEKKGRILKANPNATSYTFFGNCIVNDATRRFTFDVYFSENMTPNQKRDFIDETWNRIYETWLPANNYYAVYESPYELTMAKSIHHEGIIGKLGGTYTKGKGRGLTSEWRANPKRCPYIDQKDAQIYIQVRRKVLEYRRKQKTRRQMYA